MGDLLQNIQGVYKKWEAKSNPNRGRPRGGSFRNKFNTPRRFNENEERYSNNYRQTYNREYKRTKHNRPRYDSLAEFKMSPTVTPVQHPRPFLGIPCAKCVPRSRAGIEDSTVYLLGVYNILRIPYFSMQNFNICCIWNLFKFQQTASPSTSFDLLKCGRIEDAILKVVNVSEKEDISENILLENLCEKSRTILSDLKSSISSFYIETAGIILHYAFRRIFNGIFVNKGQIEILQNLSKEDIPFVYLPLHRSLFDYFLVPYILHLNSVKTPFIVAPDKLCIPLISYIFRMVGAIFVRKSVLDEDQDKDILYNAVVQSYIVRCLEAGHNIQFMIEGDSSTSGKPRTPKTNLLAPLVHSVLEGSVEDAYIVPISISYETVEEIPIAEQLGCKPSQSEIGFLSKIFSFWKIKYGNVRVNFNQPFSLKEFLRLHDGNHGSRSCVPDLLTFNTPNHESECNIAVKDLADHVVYDAMQCSALMSTHLLSFLFVTQYRKGGTQQQLQTSMDWLCDEVVRRKWDLGFTGESMLVVKRAVELLGKDLITTETIEMEWTSSDLENNNVKVNVYTPIVKLPHVLELQYYANMVVPLFLKESIIVNALYAIVDVDICHFHHCDSRFSISRDELIQKAIKLNEFLKFEFITVPYCQDIMSVFNDVIDELTEKECLAGIGRDQYSKFKRKSHPLSFNSDEEEFENDVGQQLKIDLREESITQLEFFRNILSPYIESYWLAACSLLKLIDEVKEESVFIHDMQMMAQDKLYKGLLAYEESFSAVTLKNALKMFNHKNIVEYDCEGAIKTICLSEPYNCFEGVNDVIADIEDFRK